MRIDLFDYILLPLYLLFFFWRVKKMAKRYPEPELKKFLVNAFALRMFGSFLYSMMVQYYYGYGDSFTYYDGGKFFAEQIRNDFTNIYYLFAPFEEMRFWFDSMAVDTSQGGYFYTPASNMVMRVSAFLSFFAFDKFLIISLFFGYFSFVGQWKLFMVFDSLNLKRNRKLLAYAILYSPSIWFWGSGLLKDSLCLGGIGFIIHILYNFIVRKKFSIMNIFFLIGLIYMVTTIKSYIVSIIALGLGVMFFSIFLKSIKNIVFRGFVMFIGIIMFLGILYVSDFSTQLAVMAEESVAEIQEFQKHYEVLHDSDETSKAGFGLGALDPSLGALLLKSPAVIATCLFRPFLWESRKLIIMFTALESTLLLLATLYLIVKMGLFKFFGRIFSTPHLLFCFTISMLFAVIIGFTTFNFGTMIRYKVIFLPFYYFLLANMFTIYKAAKEAKVKLKLTVA